MAKVKYYYEGIPLKEWCLKNEYSYSTAANFIAKNKAKYETVEDLVMAAVKELQKENNYYYEGILLKEWCQNNDYSYNTAMSILNRLKSKYEERTELVNQTVQELKKTTKKTQYYYNKQSLREYCQKNGLNYQTILSRIRKIKKSHKKITDAEAVSIAIEEYEDKRCRFTYSGISLKKYCEENNYDYGIIYRRVKDLTEKDAEKVIAAYFEKPPIKPQSRYKISGLSLREYCKKNNYVYSTVKSYIRTIKAKQSNISNYDAAIKAIIYYETNHIYKEKYFYKGERLVDYLKSIDISYKDFISYLKNMPIADTYNLSDEVVEKCIYKCQIKTRKKLFKKLETATPKEVEEIAIKLSISKDSLNLLMNHNFLPKEALNFIWYFGRKKNNILTMEEKDIEEVITKSPNNTMDLSELIGYYKCGLSDTRNLIIENCYLPCKSILYNLINKYTLFKDKNICEELESQMFLTMYEFIERTNSNNTGQIVNYMNNLVKGELLRLILNYFEHQKTISLDTKIHDDTKTTRMDFQTKKTEVDTEYIGERLLEILLTLTQIEQKVLILLYQKQYSKEEVSLKLNLSEREISEIELAALNHLKEKIPKPPTKIKSSSN